MRDRHILARRHILNFKGTLAYTLGTHFGNSDFHGSSSKKKSRAVRMHLLHSDHADFDFRSPPKTVITRTIFQENRYQMAIVNKRARHDYSIEEHYECGIVLRGWEVKSVRAGRAQIGQAHIYIRDGELFLCNAHMNPADQVCTHETLETNRTRKLLMHRKEIMKLIGRVERQGYALIPLDLHFTRGRVKCEMALARGKREYEKRADESKKEWKREQERIMKKDAKGRHIL